ncbi:MAG: tryptophan 2,3-dioxygenase family protein [Aulosira sp. DedQUE10]|nr:tryptophan 2,3-dioxygenase family protein [Aulosira sp. DedQUE10]
MQKYEDPTLESLKSSLENPIYNPILKKLVGEGNLDYEVYLNTKQLLSLQTDYSQLVIPEELMFQIVHQTQELWLKLLTFEGVRVVESLESDELWKVTLILERMLRVQYCLTEQMGVLNTLTPKVFQTIRQNIGEGSGQESPGYNQISNVAKSMEQSLERLLTLKGLTFLDIYNSEEQYLDMQRICEQMVDFDQMFQQWLINHFMLVRRTIGIDRTVRGLDGYPTVALASRMVKPLFQNLWDLRVQMTNQWKREGGFTPGEDRKLSIHKIDSVNE